jgi:hypothetical protein
MQIKYGKYKYNFTPISMVSLNTAFFMCLAILKICKFNSISWLTVFIPVIAVTSVIVGYLTCFAMLYLYYKCKLVYYGRFLFKTPLKIRVLGMWDAAYSMAKEKYTLKRLIRSLFGLR